jgi:hypothetical protein
MWCAWEAPKRKFLRSNLLSETSGQLAELELNYRGGGGWNS